jgi:hypothetical protein
MGRLTVNRDQRLGAIDLLDDLGCEPLAQAQASTMIASSGLSCRDYREHFSRRREQLADAGGKPSAAAVTWTLSLDHADWLSPGGAAALLLAICALLDGDGIPGAVFTTSAVREFLAREGAEDSADPEDAWSVMLTLERAGLVVIDPASTPSMVWMSPVVQAAVWSAFPAGRLGRAATTAADALLEVWPEDLPRPWAAQRLRSCARQPAASGRRPALVRRLSPAAAARRAEPGQCTSDEFGRRLLGGTGGDQRTAARTWQS